MIGQRIINELVSDVSIQKHEQDVEFTREYWRYLYSGIFMEAYIGEQHRYPTLTDEAIVKGSISMADLLLDHLETRKRY